MTILSKRPLLFLGILLFGLSLAIRFQIYEFNNGDMVLLNGWYDHLDVNGWAGLADEGFSNYPPAYLYLLWLSTLLPDWVGSTFAIKLIPTLFDMLSAFTIFRMARLHHEVDRSFIVAAIFFIMPTIMFNSTGWGQIESLYTSFLLICVYLLLMDKPFWALLAYGVAFSFKAQSIFLLPFLGIMLLKGRIRWHHFLLIPVTYVVLGIPAAWIGRSWESILLIYVGQVGQFRGLSMNAPNLYIFIPNSFYAPGVSIGMGVFLVSLAVWGWTNWRARTALTQRQIILMASAVLVLVPFTLPKMHDRYFYPADVFSYAAVIFVPEMWFVPMLFQLTSGMSYLAFLVRAPITFVMVAALITTGTVIYILRKQILSLR
jgi:Gpi18-like mannosyltransferase